jgi:hypothetical protein
MANANFQVSSKLPDGRIFVIAGNTADEFKGNLTQILGDVGAENLISTMAASVEGAPASYEEAVGHKHLHQVQVHQAKRVSMVR